MVMRHSNWLATALVVGTSALALAGCHRTETAKTERHERALRREPIRAISKLDCPEQATTKRATSRSTPPTTAPRSASASAATACAPP
jgi:Tfp pilus assembly protein PilP